MKVLCIKDSKVPGAEIPNVVFGETYTVVIEITRRCWCGKHDIVLYVLEERPKHIAYSAAYFAPLSDIEETVSEQTEEHHFSLTEQAF